MKYLTLAMAIGLLATHSYGSGGAETQKVEWAAGDAKSSLVLAEVLLEASKELPDIKVTGMGLTDKITAADCRARFIRPGRGLGPFRNSYNELRCRTTVGFGGTGIIVYNMEQIDIARWGNSFYPRGVSVDDETSEVFFKAMKEIYEKAGTHDGYFVYEDLSLHSPTGHYDFTDYKIIDQPDSRTISIVCTKEYLYGSNEARPAAADYTRCDFIYAHEMPELEQPPLASLE